MTNKDIKWLLNKPIAHRGFHSDKHPENTLVSFEDAVENNYNIELDVMMTKDKKIVVFHDYNTSRLTDISLSIQNNIYTDLKHIQIKGTEHTIPSIDEVLELVNSNTGILIEIKPHTHIGELEEKLCSILNNYNGKYAIQSFDHKIVQWFQENKKDILIGQLTEQKSTYEKNYIKNLKLKYLYYSLLKKPDFIGVDYTHRNLSVEILNTFFKIPILGWTIRQEEQFFKYKDKFDNLIFERFNICSTLR